MQKKSLINLPNILTLTRFLLLLPFTFYLLIFSNYLFSFILLMVCGLTDWLDGKLARWLNQVTKLGGRLDVTVDRIYAVVVPTITTIAGILPREFLIIFFIREILLIPTVFLLQKHKLPFNDSLYLGKAATFSLFYSLPILIYSKTGIKFSYQFQMLGIAILIWSIYLSCCSLYQYWKVTLIKIKNNSLTKQ